MVLREPTAIACHYVRKEHGGVATHREQLAQSTGEVLCSIPTMLRWTHQTKANELRNEKPHCPPLRLLRGEDVYIVREIHPKRRRNGPCAPKRKRNGPCAPKRRRNGHVRRLPSAGTGHPRGFRPPASFEALHTRPRFQIPNLFSHQPWRIPCYFVAPRSRSATSRAGAIATVQFCGAPAYASMPSENTYTPSGQAPSSF